MASNTRFAVAVHVLLSLAYLEEGTLTSEELAKSVKTNPVVIRRLLSALTKAGLVRGQPGKSGGSRLARRPEDITLAEVFRAVEAEGLFSMPDKPELKACAVSCNIKRILGDVFVAAEKSLEANLGKTRLIDLVKQLPARA